MKVIIDRIEGNCAVVELESGKTIDVPKELFPEAEEGMIFTIARNEVVEEEREEKIKSLFEKLKDRDS